MTMEDPRTKAKHGRGEGRRRTDNTGLARIIPTPSRMIRAAVRMIRLQVKPSGVFDAVRRIIRVVVRIVRAWSGSSGWVSG